MEGECNLWRRGGEGPVLLVVPGKVQQGQAGGCGQVLGGGGHGYEI